LRCAPRRLDGLGHVAQQQHDFVFHVDSGVAVVALLAAAGNNEAVAREDDFTIGVAVFGKGEGTKILIERERIG
jgi:hypothetical protein